MNNSNQIQDDLITYNKTGRCKEIRNKIALKNIGLMYSGLKSTGVYALPTKDNDEIQQEGFILFLEAIEAYELSRGSNFSSFWYIYAYNIFRNTYNYGVCYSNGDYNTMASLDKPIDTVEGTTTLGELIEDKECVTPDEAIEALILKDTVRTAVNELPKEQANLINDTYGIGRFKDMYISDYARFKGLTYNKAIDYKNKAITSLRGNKALRELAVEYEAITNIQAMRYDRLNSGKTNKISDPTSRVALRRMEIEQTAKRLAKDNDCYNDLLIRLREARVI